MSDLPDMDYGLRDRMLAVAFSDGRPPVPDRPDPRPLTPETLLWEELRFVKGATDDVVNRLAARLATLDAERAAPAGTPKDRQAPPSLGDGLREACISLADRLERVFILKGTPEALSVASILRHASEWIAEP